MTEDKAVYKLPVQSILSLSRAALAQLNFDNLEVYGEKIQYVEEWIFGFCNNPILRVVRKDKHFDVYTCSHVNKVNGYQLICWNSMPNCIVSHPYEVATKLVHCITDSIIKSAMERVKREWTEKAQLLELEAQEVLEKL